MSVFILNEDLVFPDASCANREGLVAIGGDMGVERLLLAYRCGIFPWTVHPITWWSPEPRAVMELSGFHASASLRKLIRKEVFSITINQAFSQVMEGCAEPAANRRETWITPEFVHAYTELHRQGWAHSLECWHDGVLAGGIYGVATGALFAGESMFHRVDNASKVALYHLVRHLEKRGYELFDLQMLTRVTRQLGGRSIPRGEYLARLRKAVQKPCTFV
jgi:leucyl/phenylalanyl-tRNA---protein transferase